jgi:phage integrase family
VSGFFLGSPIGESHLRDQMQKVIDEQGLPDVVFHVLFCFGYTNIGIEKCEGLQKSISKSIHQVLLVCSPMER